MFTKINILYDECPLCFVENTIICSKVANKLIPYLSKCIISEETKFVSLKMAKLCSFFFTFLKNRLFLPDNKLL